MEFFKNFNATNETSLEIIQFQLFSLQFLNIFQAILAILGLHTNLLTFYMFSFKNILSINECIGILSRTISNSIICCGFLYKNSMISLYYLYNENSNWNTLSAFDNYKLFMLIYFGHAASVSNLLGISIDRYLIIIRPNHLNRTKLIFIFLLYLFLWSYPCVHFYFINKWLNELSESLVLFFPDMTLKLNDKLTLFYIINFILSFASLFIHLFTLLLIKQRLAHGGQGCEFLHQRYRKMLPFTILIAVNLFLDFVTASLDYILIDDNENEYEEAIEDDISTFLLLFDSLIDFFIYLIVLLKFRNCFKPCLSSTISCHLKKPNPEVTTVFVISAARLRSS